MDLGVFIRRIHVVTHRERAAVSRTRLLARLILLIAGEPGGGWLEIIFRLKAPDTSESAAAEDTITRARMISTCSPSIEGKRQPWSVRAAPLLFILSLIYVYSLVMTRHKGSGVGHETVATGIR